jgi:hypothetical protein
MITTILLVLAGVVLSVVIGSLWYMPKTPTGKLHMKYLGFDKLSPEEQKQKIAEAKPGMPKMYLAQTFLSLLMSTVVVLLVSESLKGGIDFKTVILFVSIIWLGFVVPSVGMQILWGNCDGKVAWLKFFSDSLNILVTILLIAVMVNLFVG